MMNSTMTNTPRMSIQLISRNMTPNLVLSSVGSERSLFVLIVCFGIKMPSIEETCVRSPSSASTTQDFLARDMEELVSEMKENLRLTGYKSKQTHRTTRPSPYQIPSRWSDSNCKTCVLSSGVKSTSVHSCYNKKSKSADSDDPYELLQDLIRDGSLIKEAVRRLQKGLWPKQRYIYDSDEESSRSPMKLCQQ